MSEVRSLGESPNYEQQLPLQAKRHRLQTNIDTFISQQTEFLGTISESPVPTINDTWLNTDDDEGQDLAGALLSLADLPSSEALSPESIPLPLLSSFCDNGIPDRLRRIVKIELELRKGQANDALHSLRIAIAQKSFIFRTRIRKNAPTTGYAKRLRSYGEARGIKTTIGFSAKVYTTTRKAMERLGATNSDLSMYRNLTQQDLVASTAVMEPNARGQSRVKLSWIWHIVSDAENTQFVNECKSLFLI